MDKLHSETSRNGYSRRPRKLSDGGDELHAILSSVGTIVSQEVEDIVDKISNATPDMALQFVRKNWKPVAIATTTAVTIGLGTFAVLQKAKHGRRMSFLN